MLLRYSPSYLFSDLSTNVIYKLSLHDALPISARGIAEARADQAGPDRDALKMVDVEDMPIAYLPGNALRVRVRDRKSTRLNSSHGYISYAVFCLKKKSSCRIRNRRICRSGHHG